MMFPKTGGPHVYAYHAFGPVVSFFTGWAYWVVSWFSTPVVIIAAVNYLATIMPITSPLYWQLGLLILITLLNLKSVQSAGRVEFFLSLFKFLPLVLIPLVALSHFKIENIQPTEPLTFRSLAEMVMISLFSFLGLESATTPAEFVDKPQ